MALLRMALATYILARSILLMLPTLRDMREGRKAERIHRHGHYSMEEEWILTLRSVTFTGKHGVSLPYLLLCFKPLKKHALLLHAVSPTLLVGRILLDIRRTLVEVGEERREQHNFLPVSGASLEDNSAYQPDMKGEAGPSLQHTAVYSCKHLLFLLLRAALPGRTTFAPGASRQEVRVCVCLMQAVLCRGSARRCGMELGLHSTYAIYYAIAIFPRAVGSACLPAGLVYGLCFAVPV